MTTTKVETIQVTCDGCGRRSMNPEKGRGIWRSVRVVVSTLEGGQLRERRVDLCDECLQRVAVPGIEND